jgi:hypothetical protein
LTLSFFASATATSGATITAPASINAGDLIVLIDWGGMASGSPPTAVTPSGFTKDHDSVNSALNNDCRLIISRKIAAGTEGGTSITGMSADSNIRKIMMVFRGSSAIATATPSSFFDSGFTNGDPSAQTVTASGGTPPLVAIGATMCRDTANPTITMTPNDGTVSAGTRLRAGYKIYNASPANVSVDMADAGDSNKAIGVYYQVAP